MFSFTLSLRKKVAVMSILTAINTFLLGPASAAVAMAGGDASYFNNEQSAEVFKQRGNAVHHLWEGPSGEAFEVWVDKSPGAWSGIAVFRDPAVSPGPVVLHWSGSRPGEFTLGRFTVALAAADHRAGAQRPFKRVSLTVRGPSGAETVVALVNQDNGVELLTRTPQARGALEDFFGSREAQVVVSVTKKIGGTRQALGDSLRVSSLFDLSGCIADYILITSLIGAAIETCGSGMTWGCWAAIVAVWQAEEQIIENCNCCF